jgi:MFS family permease
VTFAERRIVLYTSAAHGLTHMLEWSYAALLLKIGDEFGADFFLLGALGNVFAWTFGFGALPSGVLTDRLGSQRILFFCFVGGTLSAVLVGLSPNAALLGVALALLGISIGLYHPAGLSIIAQGVRQRGMALGLHGVSGNVGIAITPLLVGGFAAATDWRWAYFLVAALAAVLALLLRGVSLQTRPEKEKYTPTPDPDPQPRANNSLLPLFLVYAAFVLNGFVYSASRTFLPSHITSEGSEIVGDSLATLALLMGAVGQYVGGSLSQRFPLERLAPLLAIGVIPSLVLMGSAGGAPLVVASAAFVFFSFGGQPIYNSLIAEYTPARLLGRSYGISFFAAFGLASVGSTYAGFFAQRWDTTSAVFMAAAPFAAVSFLVAGAIWLLARRRLALAPGETAQRRPSAPL